MQLQIMNWPQHKNLNLIIFLPKLSPLTSLQQSTDDDRLGNVLMSAGGVSDRDKHHGYMLWEHDVHWRGKGEAGELEEDILIHSNLHLTLRKFTEAGGRKWKDVGTTPCVYFLSIWHHYMHASDKISLDFPLCILEVWKQVYLPVTPDLTYKRVIK